MFWILSHSYIFWTKSYKNGHCVIWWLWLGGMVCTNYGKGGFMRFLCTNISSHPKDIWELIKPKSWRTWGGPCDSVVYKMAKSQSVFSILFYFHIKWNYCLPILLCKQKSWQVTIFSHNFFGQGMKLKIPDEILSHLIDF